MSAQFSPSRGAPPDGVTLTTLDNGLVIIVREDHSAPVVSAQAWCRTGSINEGDWLGAGLSHVLEHMLFKGTATRPGSRIDQEVQEAGGYMNAYTSFDRTVYWINVPNTGGRVALDILCDIMQNATLPPDELAKELDVIRREMDMNQDDPGRRSGRRLFETAFTTSPYRLTIIGYPDIFNDLKPENIRGYYRERYVPNNVFFVVAGDIQTAEVVGQIRNAYMQSKARALPPMVLPAEPRQTAPREIVEEAPIELGHFHCAWHIPELRHPDVPLLDVVATLLGSGRSARLYRQVREKLGLVHQVDAWTYNPGDSGLLAMSAVADAEKFPSARDAMLAEIDKLQAKPIPAAELQKAVKQFIAATLATRKTMQGQAQDLGGNWIATSDLNFSELYLDIVKRAKPADLQRVARQYLNSSNRTVYALLPTGAMPTLTANVSTVTEADIRKFDLPGGLRLLVKEDRRLPFVEFRAMFKGGVIAESPATNGITQVASRMLLKGTAKRSADQIAIEIESLGGNIDSYGGNNSFGVNTEVLKADFAKGLDLLADVLLHPSFPQPALDREKEVQIATIKSQRDDLLKSAARSMRRMLFGPRGYGLDASGSEDSVARLQRSHLGEFRQAFVAPGNCVLAIYGDIETNRVVTAVKRAFASWKKAGSGADSAGIQARPEPTPALKGVLRADETRDKTQAVLVIGFRSVTMDDPDRYALDLIQEACSDLGSRLFLRIREQLGLAYYVGAQHLAGLAPGYFAFYAGTEPAKAQLVETELLKEAELLSTKGLEPDELARAKSKIIGNHKIARQELGHLATATALDELYGLGYANYLSEDSRYEAVTLDRVRKVAKKYLRSDAVVIASMLPTAPR